MDDITKIKYYDMLNALMPDKYQILFNSTSNTNPNLKYKTTGDTWDLDDSTIQSMTSDYKMFLQNVFIICYKKYSYN